MTPKQWREKKGMTLGQLAEKLGCSIGYVSLLENGKRSPSFAVLKAYEALTNKQITSKNFTLQ